jgi:HD-like signal output (HDOD) protein
VLSAAIAAKLERMPPFRPAALKLFNISLDDDSADQQVEDIFKSDPALTAELLHLANGALFGRRSQVQTIRVAIRFLGLERVRSLATSIALRTQMQKGDRSKFMASVWAHGIATAVAAEALGTAQERPGMYTFGLTHDLGRLGLCLAQGNDYEAGLSAEFSGIDDANTAERNICGMTHCEAGELVARAWGFPDDLSACMGNHHTPPEAIQNDPRSIVWTACQIADSLGFPEFPQPEAPPWPVLPRALQNARELEPEALWDEIARRLQDLAH